jgi:hypothetical protein
MTPLAAFFVGIIVGIVFMNFFGQKRVVHTDSFVEKQDVGKIKQKGRQNNMEVEPGLLEKIFSPSVDKSQERAKRREDRRQKREKDEGKKQV